VNVLITRKMFLKDAPRRPSIFDSIQVRFRRRRPRNLTQGAPLMLSGRLRIAKVWRDDTPGGKLIGLYHLVDAVEGRSEDPRGPPPKLPQGVRPLTFTLLGSAQLQGTTVRLPANLKALNGEWVTVRGAALIPWTDQAATSFVLARNRWDGCCIGKRPGPTDSLLVELAEDSVLKEPTAPIQTLSGRFTIQPALEGDRIVRLYKLVDAVDGAIPPPSGGSGVLIVILVLVLAGAGVAVFIIRRRLRASTESTEA
jgi:hypothetical protein